MLIAKTKRLSIQVDQVRIYQEQASLPQELVDRCAKFNFQSGATQKLIDAMSQLSSVYTDVESLLTEVKQILNEEQERERQFHGTSKRPPNMILNELSLEANRYFEAHGKAADSNNELHAAIKAHLPNLRTLSLPLADIEKQLPNFQALDSSKDQTAIKELQRLLDKVEEMRKQRRMLYTQFREGIQTDDITKLATHQTDLEALFAQELSKHQRVTNLIEQNLSAQEKILLALTEANSRYADTRKAANEIQLQRDAIVGSLVASADAYPDLLAKCNKGLDYYKKMETSVTKLLTRLRSVCKVQQEEREQQEAARNRPAAPVLEKSDFQEGPKLKDFLHLMKKDRAAGEAVIAPVAATAPPAPSAAETPAQFTYPYQRPTPLGAEQTDSQSLPYAMDGNSFYYQNQAHLYSQGAAVNYAGYPTSTFNSAVSSAASAPAYSYPSYYPSAAYPSAYQIPTSVSQPQINTPYAGQQMQATPASTSSTAAPTPTPLPQPSVPAAGYSAASFAAVTSTTTVSAPSYASAMPNPYMSQNPYYHYGSVAGPSSTYSSTSTSYPSTSTTYGALPSATPFYGSSSNYGSSTPQVNGNLASSTYENSTTTTANQSTVPAPSTVTSNLPYANIPSSSEQVRPAYEGTQGMPSLASNIPSSYGQYQYPYPPSYSYAAATAATAATTPSAYHPYSMPYTYAATTTTTTASIPPSAYPYEYNYLAHHNNPIDSYGGYNHGMTGSTITGPATQLASSGVSGGSIASASGTNQYQQYPYHPTPADAASPYYQANAYSQQPYTNQVLQPTQVDQTPASSAAPVAPTATPAEVEKAASNLELLSLLDLSVPANPNGAVLPAVLKPESGQIPLGGRMEHQGTTTWSGSNRNSMIGPVATATETGKSISSSTESPINPQAVPLSQPAEVKPTTNQQAHKDPLADPEIVAKLASEVEKLDKLVDGLTRKSLNGPTPLDARLKEVQDLQEKESSRRSISVARCYPMKNRLPDVLPYDHNRVELAMTKDDYINASLIPSLSSGAPSFIATQAPLSCSQQDFWTMIWQQSVEIIVCLLSDAELTKPGSGTTGVYWPVEKGHDVSTGPWTISLQSNSVRPYCNERILALTKHVNFDCLYSRIHCNDVFSFRY